MLNSYKRIWNSWPYRWFKVTRKNNSEVKDEIETIQSSDSKTERKVSISEDASNISRKINLDQAYKILRENSILDALIKTFST